MAAEGKVGLMMNVPQGGPGRGAGDPAGAAERRPISSLSDPDWVAVNTIIDEDTVRHIIPQLKAAGASGIVEYPLNKIID